MAHLTELDHPIDLSGWSKYSAFVQIVKEVLASDNFCFQVTSHWPPKLMVLSWP